MTFSITLLIYFAWLLKTNIATDHVLDEGDPQCTDTQTNQSCYVTLCPLIRCSNLPDEFLDCEQPHDWKGNLTAKEEAGYGCVKFGGTRHRDVETGNVRCRVLSCDIECFGPRSFLKKDQPCIKYTGHYFLSTLLYSILLGVIAMDRFCLGHTGVAVGKLMTLGGFGIWWLVDVVLLVTGHLTPIDDSNWMPYY